MTTVSITRTDTDTELPTYQTGADLKVQEVKAAVARASRDDRTERERQLEEQLDRLAHENTQLRIQLGGWTPTRDWRTITGAGDLTERQRNAAMVAPTVEQLRNETPLAAELVAGVDRKPGWPVWLDEFHHLHKVDKERWTRLHAMIAESEARTGTPEPPSEPDGWAWAEYHDVPLPEFHPARELAPARLDAEHDDRVQRMINDPERYFSDARARARREVLAEMAEGVRREPTKLQPATEDPPKRTGWKRPTWLTRAFDAVFPLKPRKPRKDGGA